MRRARSAGERVPDQRGTEAKRCQQSAAPITWSTDSLSITPPLLARRLEGPCYSVALWFAVQPSARLRTARSQSELRGKPAAGCGVIGGSVPAQTGRSPRRDALPLGCRRGFSCASMTTPQVNVTAGYGMNGVALSDHIASHCRQGEDTISLINNHPRWRLIRSEHRPMMGQQGEELFESTCSNSHDRSPGNGSAARAVR
jgi:hypothetical protein